MNLVYFTPIPKWEILNHGVDNICRFESAIQWYRPKNILNCSEYSELKRSVYESKEKYILDSLNIIEKFHPNFHVFPVHNILCDSLKCPSHIKDIRL